LSERILRHRVDPSPVIEALFRRIETERMQDVPMLNAALRVEALGFSRWSGNWLGMLITPWSINLMLLSGERSAWQGVADGARVFYRFASGDFAFVGGHEPEIGEYHSCALYTRMGELSDQDMARDFARTALGVLRRNPAANPAAPGLPNREVAVASGAPRPLDRRGFLGRLFMRRGAPTARPILPGKT
jgi:[NiFe] hydrogenase assembly HybE family chaperone